MDNNTGLLNNIRVLDFTHVLAGPFCSYQLAVMGADVIKIESPERIDMMRFNGPAPSSTQNNMSLHYQAQSANKRAMTLDLTHPDSAVVLDKLIASADVLVVNYRKKAAEKLLIDYERVKQIKPDIIYCSLTGFGQTGPKCDHPAYDNVIQAFSGLMAATGSEQQGPVRVGPPVLDYGTGAQAALAIASSLFQRERTGNGNFIDIAMLDAALMLMSSTAVETAICAKPPTRFGNRSIRASYGCYKTNNGELMLGAYTQSQIKNLWQTLGCTAQAIRTETLQPHQLDDTFDEDTQLLSDILSTRSATEWETQLNEADVPAARVRTLDETLQEPQVQSRSVMQTLPESAATQENAPTMSVPVSAWSSTHGSPRVTSAPPRVGEHTAEILMELGFTENPLHSSADLQTQKSPN